MREVNNNLNLTRENILLYLMKFIRTIICLFVLCLCPPVLAADEALDQAISDTVKTHEEAEKTQQTIDKLADSTQDMLQEYRNTLQQTDSLKSYNNQLEKIITNQEETLVSVKRQLDSVEGTQRNIVPLMLRMVAVLGEFIHLDMPFLREERMARQEILQEMMDRSDVTLPDKFRRVMEAYQIEMGYGRTIATGNETILMDGKQYTVNTLRIGRLAYLYQTLDGKESGYWSKQSGGWEKLPKDYNASIAEGILIADRQAPPNLFKIPVPAAEPAR